MAVHRIPIKAVIPGSTWFGVVTSRDAIPFRNALNALDTTQKVVGPFKAGELAGFFVKTRSSGGVYALPFWVMATYQGARGSVFYLENPGAIELLDAGASTGEDLVAALGAFIAAVRDAAKPDPTPFWVKALPWIAVAGIVGGIALLVSKAAD